MVERGGGVGLALESGQEEPPHLGITGELAMNDLYGDMPAGMFLTRQEDRPYAVETERAFQHAGTHLDIPERLRIPADIFLAYVAVAAFGKLDT
jgi:hypothetical protein